MQIGDCVQIESDDDFNGDSGVIKIIDDGVVFWVLIQTRMNSWLVPCEEHELVPLEEAEKGQIPLGVAGRG